MFNCCLSFSPILIASLKNAISVATASNPSFSLIRAFTSYSLGCNATGSPLLPFNQEISVPSCVLAGNNVSAKYGSLLAGFSLTYAAISLAFI